MAINVEDRYKDKAPVGDDVRFGAARDGAKQHQKRVLAAGTAGLGAILVLEGLFIVILDIPALDSVLTPLLEGRAGGIAIAVLWVLVSRAGYRAQLRGRRKKKKKDED